jgi:hypothetical protein
MSDTPRTDSAIRDSGGQWSYGLRETCEQLERELAAMTQRRDELLASLEKVVTYLSPPASAD